MMDMIASASTNTTIINSTSLLCARATWSQYSLFGVCRQVRKGSNFTIAWSYREATADVFVWHGTFVGDLRRDGFRRVKYEENDGVLLFPPADNVVTLRFSFVSLKSDAWLVQRCLRFGIVGRRFQFRFWKEGKVLRWTGTVVGRSGRHLQVLYDQFRQRVLSLPPPASACITPINVYFFPCCKCVTDMSSRTSVARATQQSCLEVGKRRPRLSNSKKHKGLEKNFMCFNTRSMKAPWRQRELDEILMQKSVSIARLQETRWKSIDAAKNITNYNVIMQPASPKGVGGVAILVRKDLEVEAMESANSSFQAARVGDHLFIIKPGSAIISSVVLLDINMILDNKKTGGGGSTVYYAKLCLGKPYHHRTVNAIALHTRNACASGLWTRRWWFS